MARSLLAVVLMVGATVGALVAFIWLPYPPLTCLVVSTGVIAFACWALVRSGLVDRQQSSLGTAFAGMLAPSLAGTVGIMTYASLTQASAERDADFVFRLGSTIAVMALPALAVLAIAFFARRRQPLGAAGKTGIAMAVLSLGLTWVPLNGLLNRQEQAQNLALDVVAAPPFDTVDISGERHRLEDHSGKVVLINIWATWCGPCRREMPQLEALYQSRREDGLVVFGLSTEDAALQREFAEDVVVSYPLLTVDGDVPETYSTTARYPANFIVDREGQLRAAPSTDRPFAELEAMVDSLLAAGGGR